jgi:hypothetical protein
MSTRGILELALTGERARTFFFAIVTGATGCDDEGNLPYSFHRGRSGVGRLSRLAATFRSTAGRIGGRDDL